MPHVVDVKCPACGGHACFEFAEVVRITKKEDVAYFQASDLFEYRFVQGSFVRPGNWHAAIYYHGLHRHSLAAVTDLPEGYSSKTWAHSKYWYRGSADHGTVRCNICYQRQKHQLEWPRDAFFQVDIRGNTLWAFNQESLIALRHFIASRERGKARRGPYQSFLMKVPTHFLEAKVRDEAVKKLNGLLKPQAPT